MKLEIENRDVDYDVIQETIKLGPQKEILDDIDFINNKWICANWVYGNRSNLEPIEPLSVTKTFRWSPGYKQKVIACLLSRFDQYDKKSGTLTTLFNRRNGADWYRKQFEEKIVNVDDKMRRLRAENITFSDNTEAFKEGYNIFMNHFDTQKQLLSSIIENNDNIEANIDLYRISDDVLDNTSVNGHELTENDKEVIKYEQTYVVAEFIFKNSPMTFVNNANEVIGEYIIEDDIVIYYCAKMDAFVNKIMATGDFSVTRDRINNTSNHSNYYNNSISGRANLNRTYNWSLTAAWKGEERQRYNPFLIDTNYNDGDMSIKLYPYISQNGNRENLPQNVQSIVNQEYITKHVCFGDLDTEISHAFLNMDWLGVLNLFPSWNTWHVTRSNPLNQIKYLFTTKTKKVSQEIWDQIGFDEGEAFGRLSNKYHTIFGPEWRRQDPTADNWADVIDRQGIDTLNNKCRTYLLKQNPYVDCNSDTDVMEFIKMYQLDEEEDWGYYFITEHCINARFAIINDMLDDDNWEVGEDATREKDLYDFLDWISQEGIYEKKENKEDNIHDNVFFEEVEMMEADFNAEARDQNEREMAMWAQTHERSNNG
tara:strand:+ start:818 stop:2605 length:1788 start_codon:yes stop_codon:yes gene_type:complete